MCVHIVWKADYWNFSFNFLTSTGSTFDTYLANLLLWLLRYVNLVTYREKQTSCSQLQRPAIQGTKTITPNSFYLEYDAHY